MNPPKNITMFRTPYNTTMLRLSLSIWCRTVCCFSDHAACRTSQLPHLRHYQRPSKLSISRRIPLQFQPREQNTQTTMIHRLATDFTGIAFAPKSSKQTCMHLHHRSTIFHNKNKYISNPRPNPLAFNLLAFNPPTPYPLPFPSCCRIPTATSSIEQRSRIPRVLAGALGTAHPRGAFFAARRRSFMREIIPASAAAEADVPLTCSTLPPTTTTKLCPAADISGKPLLR